MARVVAGRRGGVYVRGMSETPVFLDRDRPPVPAIVVPRGVTSFFLPGRQVRGRLVRLGVLADALIARHDYEPRVGVLMGEALALVAGLAAALKFRGTFSLQAKGDGPVPMLLADCTDTGELRGYAHVKKPALETVLARDPEGYAAALLGKGYLAFTVDQGPDTDRHQGIVTITGLNLVQMAQHYFRTSEQLDCQLHLACAKTENGWRAAAFILERVAGAGGVDLALTDEEQAEAWTTAIALGTTLTQTELLDDALSAEQILWRLFHEEGVAIDRSRALSYGCRCSRARLAGILGGFGAEDLEHMEVGGAITMTCEFCNYDFRFSRTEVGAEK